ncbi:OmpP1/FadL family transporter [Acidobacteriota bacterium]
MYKHTKILGLFFLVLWYVLSPSSIYGQLTIGQYEDEAPFRTWNIYGTSSALSFGMGNARYAVPAKNSWTANPALLTLGPEFSISLTGATTESSIQKYGIINTGVFITSEDTISARYYSLDSMGIQFRYRDWGIGFSTGILEDYGRPKVDYEEDYEGIPVYTLNFSQEGYLRGYSIGLSRKFGKKISLGVGINIVDGTMTESFEEELLYLQLSYDNHKNHKLQGLFFNGGIHIQMSERIAIAAVIRTPYTKKTASDSIFEYNSSLTNTNIQIKADAENTYKIPLLLGLGFHFNLTDSLRMAMDLSYFNWAQYKVHYFDEDFDRNFRNVLKFNTGLEYATPINLFGQEALAPLRVGFIYDPQPMRFPQSRYLYFTMGAGLQIGRFTLDIAAIIGRESGSGHGLFAQKSLVTISYRLDRGPLT